MNGVCNVKLFLARPPWGPGGGGQKIKNHLISITKSFLKIFISNFVCVLTNENETGFLFCRLGHAPGVGLWGARGAQVVKKNFKHGHVAYQIDEDHHQTSKTESK